MSTDRNILEFINEYWAINYNSPSIRDIANHLHISTSHVNYWLRRLAQAGYLLDHRPIHQTRQIIPAWIKRQIDLYLDPKSEQ